jgi:hypothetical protein
MLNPATKPAAPLTVTMLPNGRRIAAAPGALTGKTLALDAEQAPTVGIFRWQPAGDGTFKPTARIHEQFVDLQVAVEALGVPRDTLRRLIDAGFVAGRKPSPMRRQVNIASLSNHLTAVEEDPDFWTEARVKQFAGAL